MYAERSDVVERAYIQGTSIIFLTIAGWVRQLALGCESN